jgi:ABC-type transport system substrate-binding protein
MPPKPPGLQLWRVHCAGIDAAIEAGRSGNCGTADRKSAYATFNRILNDEQPYNFGFTPTTLVAVDRRLRGFAPGPFDEVPELEKLWLAR